ncbi:MAG: nucleotidyl transferase AbiEii/AbiGii toxin family protein [Kiritimatiellae bacterium]|nr:nucleotidyl transferase AbiEii/AbiGii toxin family protein [Kiritimatiellia bacterium]
MIPRADIVEWRTKGHPWQSDAMVEQDLLISRMLVELFNDDFLAERLIFRGGTALHKLVLPEALRYSEDIDLVQTCAEPIGSQFDRIRALFRGWLGEPKRKTGTGVATLTYRMESEDAPPLPLKVKIEINTREHFQIKPVRPHAFEVNSRWFAGQAVVPVYQVEELLATKLRALYQRRKGRDLFDLAMVLRTCDVDVDLVLDIFSTYLREEGHPIGQNEFVENVTGKLKHPGFCQDCSPLVRPGTVVDVVADYEVLQEMLLGRM